MKSEIILSFTKHIDHISAEQIKEVVSAIRNFDL